MSKHVPRIFIENLKNEEFEISGSQFYHLFLVLKFSISDEFIAFNEKEGEWLCSSIEIKKKHAICKRLELIRTIEQKPNLYLAFCPIKNDNTKLIIEKGTELGVTKFFPIISKFTNSKLNIEKMKLIAISASEQSERLDIPFIFNCIEISKFLNNLPPDVTWFSCIEKFSSLKLKEDMTNKNCGFIIGPEGGFSENEKQQLIENTISISVSKNILRSETAAISCLSIYNFFNC